MRIRLAGVRIGSGELGMWSGRNFYSFLRIQIQVILKLLGVPSVYTLVLSWAIFQKLKSGIDMQPALHVSCYFV